jgi:hypothetical protein
MCLNIVIRHFYAILGVQYYRQTSPCDFCPPLPYTRPGGTSDTPDPNFPDGGKEFKECKEPHG